MRTWLYKWLPIVFGCHCLDSRSFHYKGQKFPLCARCTGELVGIVAAFASIAFARPPLWVLPVLMVPMVLDGGIQMFTPYESGNLRRLITGTLFGFGLTELFLLSTAAVFRYGITLGEQMAA